MVPRVVLHHAVSLDGRIEGFTPAVAEYYRLAGHWHEDATLAGSDTILTSGLAANGASAEGASPPPGPRPLLVVPDSRGRVRCWPALRRAPYWSRMVALCARSTPGEYLGYLQRERVDCIVSGSGRVDLAAALEALAERYDVKVVRVDSGGSLAGALFQAGLADELSLLVHPCLVGGCNTRSLFRATGVRPDCLGVTLRLAHSEAVGEGLMWLRYEIPNGRVKSAKPHGRSREEPVAAGVAPKPASGGRQLPKGRAGR